MNNKKIQFQVREPHEPKHFMTRSTHKSAPQVGLTHQPQTEKVEVQIYG